MKPKFIFYVFMLFCSLYSTPQVYLTSYQDSRLWLIPLDYIEEIVGNKEVAELIYLHSVKEGVPPIISVALCWRESEFKINAFNRNVNGTVDRGLFQLNSQYYNPNTIPEVTVNKEIYYPFINIKYGVRHLAKEYRYWRDSGDINYLWKAYASYNCGRKRVIDNTIPKSTFFHATSLVQKCIIYLEDFFEKDEL